MKPSLGILLGLLTTSTIFAESATTVSIGGRTYRNIAGVSLNQDGSVGVVVGSAIINFPVKDVPGEFLASWGITPEQIKNISDSAAGVMAARAQKEKEAAQAAKAADAKRPLVFTPEISGGITLSHLSAANIKADLHKKLTNLNTPEDEIKLALSQVPTGGTVKAYLERSTIGAANTKYFTFIVFDSMGKEALRHVGSNDIANVPSRNSRMWWNIELFDLIDTMERPITIRVVDTLQNEAYEFRSN